MEQGHFEDRGKNREGEGEKGKAGWEPSGGRSTQTHDDSASRCPRGHRIRFKCGLKFL